MKKVVAMMLSLVMALGLLAGCGQKDAGTAGGTKTIESLKIAFSPYADADQITTATEPLEALLKAKLLEKGYDVQNIDMTVGTSYTAVGEALSAGSADIGFISGGNYVLFSDDCDVLLTALRYGINKDSDNPADWNDGTIEENTQDMTTYYRSIILALAPRSTENDDETRLRGSPCSGLRGSQRGSTGQIRPQGRILSVCRSSGTVYAALHMPLFYACGRRKEKIWRVCT